MNSDHIEQIRDRIISVREQVEIVMERMKKLHE